MANKTTATGQDPAAFLAGVEPAQRRDEALALDLFFRDATGFEPCMRGPSIIGYGRYSYRYDSGRRGDSLATGFSPRKAALSIYILPGYADFGPLLSRLGKHSAGKSSLYVKRLADIDMDVLRELIIAGLADLSRRWTVSPV
jgi:hypothetical protein